MHKHINKTTAKVEKPRSEFGQAGGAVISNWLLLGEVAKVVYEARTPGRKLQNRTVKVELRHLAPAPAAQDRFDGTAPSVKAQGCFVTLFVDVKTDMEHLLGQLLKSGRSREGLAIELRNSVAHQEVFACAITFVERIVAKTSAGSWALALEIGTSSASRRPGLVHLHIFFCAQSVEDDTLQKKSEWLKVDPADLVFLGTKPQHFSLMRGSRRCGFSAGVGAMYYLLSDKRGGIFQHGSHTPFEDDARCLRLAVVSLALPCPCCPCLCCRCQSCAPHHATRRRAAVMRRIAIPLRALCRCACVRFAELPRERRTCSLGFVILFSLAVGCRALAAA